MFFITLESDNNFGCDLVNGSGLQSIRQYLIQLNNPGFFILREQKIQQLLNGNAISIKKLLAAKTIKLEKNQSLIIQRCHDEEIKIRTSASKWEELKDAVDLKESECKEDANNALTEVRVKVTDRILHDFSRSYDPKEWMQKECQYELKSLMEDHFTRPFTRHLENHIKRDKMWVS